MTMAQTEPLIKIVWPLVYVFVFSTLVDNSFFSIGFSLAWYRPQKHFSLANTSYCYVNWIVVHGNVFGLL